MSFIPPCIQYIIIVHTYMYSNIQCIYIYREKHKRREINLKKTYAQDKNRRKPRTRKRSKFK